MEKYERYEALLGRKLNDGDKRIIDLGLALGNDITIENGAIIISSRLTPEQKRIVEQAKKDGTIVGGSIACFDVAKKPETKYVSSFNKACFSESVFGESGFSEPVICKVQQAQIGRTSITTRMKNFLKRFSNSILEEKAVTYGKRK